MIITILCACIFLGVKYFEYSHKFEEGLLPGHWYHAQPTIPFTNANGAISHGYATFFSFYFMMTGLHGIHILVGIILLAWIAVRAQSRRIFARVTTHPSTWWACTGTWSI